MILMEKIKILEKQLYCVRNYSYISHSKDFKSHTKESRNVWKVIDENLSSRSSFHSEC